MKKDNKIIKFLETVAILILIASFIILAYCVYISFRTEQDVLGNYDAKKTAAEINEKNEINISETIEKINKSVVGISKVKNKGNTIFLQEGVSELGLGTGFIVTDDGYIVTNQHVSGDKNSTCYVTLEDGRNYEATVVWADSDIDLSVIKIKAKNLAFLTLGDSENIKIAQNVYAIGNPIGYEFQRTVTSGIISGLERTIKIEESEKTYYMENLIQTDATINLGNSGGPLINENGEVIGINSVKITTAEGIGFAIPINNVKPIIKKLEEKGEVNSATLGVYAYDKDIVPYINEQLGTKMSLENGIYIAEIIRNSPADKAKLKKGDVILEIDGIKLNKMSTLRNYIYEKEVGDTVTVRYVHNKKENEIEITLGKK